MMSPKELGDYMWGNFKKSVKKGIKGNVFLTAFIGVGITAGLLLGGPFTLVPIGAAVGIAATIKIADKLTTANKKIKEKRPQKKFEKNQKQLEKKTKKAEKKLRKLTEKQLKNRESLRKKIEARKKQQTLLTVNAGKLLEQGKVNPAQQKELLAKLNRIDELIADFERKLQSSKSMNDYAKFNLNNGAIAIEQQQLLLEGYIVRIGSQEKNELGNNIIEPELQEKIQAARTQQKKESHMFGASIHRKHRPVDPAIQSDQEIPFDPEIVESLDGMEESPQEREPAMQEKASAKNVSKKKNKKEKGKKQGFVARLFGKKHKGVEETATETASLSGSIDSQEGEQELPQEQEQVVSVSLEALKERADELGRLISEQFNPEPAFIERTKRAIDLLEQDTVSADISEEEKKHLYSKMNSLDKSLEKSQEQFENVDEVAVEQTATETASLSESIDTKEQESAVQEVGKTANAKKKDKKKDKKKNKKENKKLKKLPSISLEALEERADELDRLISEQFNPELAFRQDTEEVIDILERDTKNADISKEDKQRIYDRINKAYNNLLNNNQQEQQEQQEQKPKLKRQVAFRVEPKTDSVQLLSQKVTGAKQEVSDYSKQEKDIKESKELSLNKGLKDLRKEIRKANIPEADKKKFLADLNRIKGDFNKVAPSKQAQKEPLPSEDLLSQENPAPSLGLDKEPVLSFNKPQEAPANNQSKQGAQEQEQPQEVVPNLEQEEEDDLDLTELLNAKVAGAKKEVSDYSKQEGVINQSHQTDLKEGLYKLRGDIQKANIPEADKKKFLADLNRIKGDFNKAAPSKQAQKEPLPSEDLLGQENPASPVGVEKEPTPKPVDILNEKIDQFERLATDYTSLSEPDIAIEGDINSHSDIIKAEIGQSNLSDQEKTDLTARIDTANALVNQKAMEQQPQAVEQQAVEQQMPGSTRQGAFRIKPKPQMPEPKRRQAHFRVKTKEPQQQRPEPTRWDGFRVKPEETLTTPELTFEDLKAYVKNTRGMVEEYNNLALENGNEFKTKLEQSNGVLREEINNAGISKAQKDTLITEMNKIDFSLVQTTDQQVGVAPKSMEMSSEDLEGLVAQTEELGTQYTQLAEDRSKVSKEQIAGFKNKNRNTRQKINESTNLSPQEKTDLITRMNTVETSLPSQQSNSEQPKVTKAEPLTAQNLAQLPDGTKRNPKQELDLLTQVSADLAPAQAAMSKKGIKPGKSAEVEQKTKPKRKKVTFQGVK